MINFQNLKLESRNKFKTTKYFNDLLYLVIGNYNIANSKVYLRLQIMIDISENPILLLDNIKKGFQ